MIPLGTRVRVYSSKCPVGVHATVIAYYVEPGARDWAVVRLDDKSVYTVDAICLRPE